ncbi:MAG TPA: LLM class flavin-dependent oxidoreductase [Candidatus Lustribacter sp.]|nr:LLM class flavin-dependent oxidoreductase [Candidatus Lustribacter sp.]
MKIGIFDHVDRTGEPLRDFYEQRLRICELYDREGLYCYHVAEHHSTPLGLAPAPSVYLSAVAQRTKRLRLAPLVYLLPFYHPLRLIEEICMLDQLSGGRYEIGVGRGISPIEAGFYGVDTAESGEQYAEILAIVQAGLRERNLTFSGKHYSFDDVPLEIAPLQSPFPPFWYGVHAAESAERAARAGFNVVTNEGPERTASVAAAYRAAWQSAPGVPAVMPEIGVVRHIVVAATDAEAVALAEPAYARWHHSFFHLFRRYMANSSHNKAPDLAGAIAAGTAVVGSPDTVATVLLRQWADSGFTYLLGQFAFGDLAFADTVRSVELFARHVMPVLQDTARGAVVRGPG